MTDPAAGTGPDMETCAAALLQQATEHHALLSALKRRTYYQPLSDTPMSATLLDFIRSRRLGDLQLGVTRAEISHRLGPPSNWGGKPPVIGLVIPKAEDSNLWLYYGDAVGLMFDEDGVSISIIIYLSEIDRSLYPFLDWPFEMEARMSDLREWLIGNDVSFQDVYSPEEYFITIEGLGLASCFPFEKGRMVDEYRRKIWMIQVVSNVEHLTDYIQNPSTIDGETNPSAP